MDDLRVESWGERGIRMTRSFRASREMVFKAWTTPQLLQKWLLGPEGWTMPVCEVDLRVGGGYRYVWRNEANGSEMGMRGEYREIVPAERLVCTEMFEMFDEAWYPGAAVSTLSLKEDNGITVATTVVEYDSAATRDGVLRSPMETGVRASYNRMERELVGGI